MNHCQINHLFYPLGGLDASCAWKMVMLMGTFSGRRTGWPGLPVLRLVRRSFSEDGSLGEGGSRIEGSKGHSEPFAALKDKLREESRFEFCILFI